MPVPQAAILAADDDPQFLAILDHHLRAWAYRVECVGDKPQLFERLRRNRPNVLLLDVHFGDHDGIEVLRQVLDQELGIHVVMLTAFGTIESAISAMKFGAKDYLTKPIDLPRLRSILQNAATTCEGRRSPSPTEPGVALPGPLTRPILGESSAVRVLKSQISRAAPSDATVLITGESGTGKELVARALHESSPRGEKSFVPLNVAALPRELIESTLFGHAKGSFTGADRSQAGCCEAADGGTLFLDEIGEMEIGLQAKLLRFLQERAFHRVGESKPMRVDVRIVAATNRDLREQVRRGLLREDLYYRLNVVPISLPPLRERRVDIPLLVESFRSRITRRTSRPMAAFSPAAIDALVRHDWPGNVRELENLVERLAVLCPGDIIDLDEVSEVIGTAARTLGEARTARAGLSELQGEELRHIDRVERQAIVEALARSEGNVREAARQLGMGQATVYRKIKKYNLSRAC